MPPRTPVTPKPISATRHDEKRANIPTEELRDFVADDENNPAMLRYPRDPSLDPQLVWQGKDAQDGQDLIVPAVPVYIQEKIHPQAIIEAQQLKQQIYAIFDTDCPQIAQERYRQVLALRSATCQATPEAQSIFDFLQHHWPKLVNAVGNDHIPKTNNTVELVIRRFDQHYQNFCGFDTIETAQLYLGVFEKLYRFTPFSQACPEPAEGMPRNASAANPPCSWRATQSMTCPWLPFVPAWQSTGLRR